MTKTPPTDAQKALAALDEALILRASKFQSSEKTTIGENLTRDNSEAIRVAIEALEMVKEDSMNHDLLGLELKTVGHRLGGGNIYECLKQETRLKCESAIEALKEAG